MFFFYHPWANHTLKDFKLYKGGTSSFWIEPVWQLKEKGHDWHQTSGELIMLLSRGAISKTPGFRSNSNLVLFGHKMSWLVVSTPLNNINQLGWWNSQYMEIIISMVPNHQPVKFTQTGNIHFSFVIPVATPTQATSTSHRAVIWIPTISAWISCGPGPRHKEGMSSDNFGAFCKKNDGLSILKPWKLGV